ncbi:hypothetical protein GCM10010991_28560 [Gemmobacter aquaticus]|uniref:Uncharacterized protein n=1 Tax=Gemmobacter aquaticus TaxID=490185 RepID=A0A917YL23_9RHOB|nr:hypothetical protein [Gemmobacter aquaticus]GGO35761.1 hypothetical protein GCM10010991_28560 [Gemmobacter aquaticus]
MTPSLHPQVVASLEDFDSDTEGELQEVVEAFTAAYETVGKILDAREAVEQDHTLTPADRILRVADVADKVMERATKAFDKAAANMRSGIANIEKELTTSVQSRATHTIAVEVRTYIRSVNSPMDFVMKAINSGDHDTAMAALGAPAYLSGLKPEAQATLLRIYHAKHNPGLVKRQRAMQAAAALLDRNSGLIFKIIEKAVGVYEDPKTKRKFHPNELRKLKQSSAKAFAQLGG